jgi:7,8-dihydropterin-6-yl-methyl-4-(beta-D-ribofuranosyl)aminobenzene 5'-phosphate synthase
MTAKLSVVCENRVGLSKGLIAEHGFCALIEAEGAKILWDTGQGLALAKNGPALGINLKGLLAIALSHGHFDHTGGLKDALAMAGGAKVVCHPACFEKKMTRREFFGKQIEVPVGMPWKQSELEAMGARFEFATDSVELAPGIHFFGSIPMETDFERIEPGFFIQDEAGKRDDTFNDDAALAVLTDKGLSVILGCAHRGMINTVAHIQRRLGAVKLHSIWGGTHLIERKPEQVDATISALSSLDPETVAAAHCTGFMNEARLATALPGKFLFAHVGVKAEL